MQRRRLGRSEIEIAPLILGSNVFGWTADKSASFTILDRFLAGGGNCIDTANMYSVWLPGHPGGESEAIIGAWLKRRGKRDDLVIATKVGMKMGDGRHGLAPAYIRVAIDESLQRLQTDYVDLYQAHEDDLSVPQEETLGAFAELIQAGKVRAIGASNFSAERLKSALAVSRRLGLPRYETLQPRYNLVERQAFEADLQPLCVAEEIGVVPYYGLARGFLTGKYRSEGHLAQSPRGGAIGQFLNERGHRVLDALDEVAAETGTSPAQVALAWLKVQPAIAAPIASASKPHQLEEIVGALRLELSAEQIARLRQASRS